MITEFLLVISLCTLSYYLGTMGISVLAWPYNLLSIIMFVIIFLFYSKILSLESVLGVIYKDRDEILPLVFTLTVLLYCVKDFI